MRNEVVFGGSHGDHNVGDLRVSTSANLEATGRSLSNIVDELTEVHS